VITLRSQARASNFNSAWIFRQPRAIVYLRVLIVLAPFVHGHRQFSRNGQPQLASISEPSFACVFASVVDGMATSVVGVAMAILTRIRRRHAR